MFTCEMPTLFEEGFCGSSKSRRFESDSENFQYKLKSTAAHGILTLKN